jgi:hypothetical protein
MKTSQSIAAVCILAVMVFGITFAMNYVGGGGSDPSPGPTPDGEQRQLTFLNEIFPEPGEPRLDCEDKSEGSHDYWFRNENDAPVRLGLNRKSCKCTSVQVFVPPEQAQPKLKPFVDGLLATRQSSGWQALARDEVRRAAARAVQASAEPQELFRQEVVTVPGGADGWVRLQWKGERPGAQLLDATLWMGSESGKTVTLRAGLMFHEPLRVTRELRLGAVQQADLSRGVEASFLAWSSTRAELKLRVRARRAGDPKADPFEVGKPVRLSEEDRAALERLHNPEGGPPPGQGDLAGRVLCAYRIPVTLRAVSADGKTPFDLGPFRRWVQIEAADAGDPVQASLVGRVRGLVAVANDEQGGVVSVGTFQRSKGKSTEVMLESEAEGVRLKVDRGPGRTPDFLTADLGTPERSGRTQTWRMRVGVKPNTVSGPFPRPEDPGSRDTSVYLKVSRLVGGKETALPPLRIPVSGIANDE